MSAVVRSKFYWFTCQSSRQAPGPFQQRLSQQRQHQEKCFPRNPCYPTKLISHSTDLQTSNVALSFSSRPHPLREKCLHCGNDNLETRTGNINNRRCIIKSMNTRCYFQLRLMDSKMCAIWEIFDEVSKVIWNCSGIASLSSLIGQEKLCQPFNRSL